MKQIICFAFGIPLMTGCMGEGKRQSQMFERKYGMPMSEILAKIKPKQIEERRRAGEIIEIVGEKNKEPVAR